MKSSFLVLWILCCWYSQKCFPSCGDHLKKNYFRQENTWRATPYFILGSFYMDITSSSNDDMRLSAAGCFNMFWFNKMATLKILTYFWVIISYELYLNVNGLHFIWFLMTYLFSSRHQIAEWWRNAALLLVTAILPTSASTEQTRARDCISCILFTYTCKQWPDRMSAERARPAPAGGRGKEGGGARSRISLSDIILF